MEPTPSRGAQLLQRFFSERRNQSMLVDRTGLKQYQLSKFASGARTPGPKDRAVLEDAIGIHWRAWDEPALPEQEASGEPAPTFRDSNQATGTHGVG